MRISIVSLEVGSRKIEPLEAQIHTEWIVCFQLDITKRDWEINIDLRLEQLTFVAPSKRKAEGGDGIDQLTGLAELGGLRYTAR